VFYESSGRSRVPFESGSRGYRPRINPRAGLLRVGARVRPNLRSRRASRDHPQGQIVMLIAGVALVRWEDRSEAKIDVRLLRAA
jgi:hypothetical protein